MRAERIPPEGAPSHRAPAVQVWARDGRRTDLAPGALDALRLLGPGRVVELVRGDGRSDRWRVTATEPAPGPVATDRIEVDDARGELRLTICGGPYLPDVGGYERSVVLRCAPEDVRAAA